MLMTLDASVTFKTSCTLKIILDYAPPEIVDGVAGSGGELRREGFCSWDVESGRRGLKAASVGTDWSFKLNVWSSQLFPL